MMKIGYYCYTRGERPDYRDFVIPSYIQGGDLSSVRNLVSPILETELKEPVWVLYKTSELLIWGVCCKNSLLSQKYYSDEKGRFVKGFFSVVFSDFSVSGMRIPYDISYFKEMYEIEISPHWSCAQGEQFVCIRNEIYHGSYKFITASENDILPKLNTDCFLKKRLGESKVEEVIASALTVNTISLSIGYDGMGFMNCVVPGMSDKTVPVERACPMCGKLVSQYTTWGVCDDCTRKKIINTPPKKDMEQKKHDLLELERQLLYSRLEIEEKEKKIKKQKFLIYILWIICGILMALSLWLFNKSKDERYTREGERSEIHQKKSNGGLEPFNLLDDNSNSTYKR